MDVGKYLYIDELFSTSMLNNDTGRINWLTPTYPHDLFDTSKVHLKFWLLPYFRGSVHP